MSKTKKPSKAQIEVLKKLNEDICICEACYVDFSTKWVDLFDYKNFMYRNEFKVSKKTFEALVKNKFIYKVLSKTNGLFNYYFITEQGKQSTNGENKEA